MKINSLCFNFTNGISQKNVCNATLSFCGKNEDVFEKSSSKVFGMSDASVCETVFTPQEIKKLYDSVFDEVLFRNCDSNPVFHQVNFKKPSINISPLSELAEVGAIATYKFLDNSITVSDKLLNEDIYCFCLKNKQSGNVDSSSLVFSSQLESELEYCKSENIPFELVKLNKKEKELFVCSCLAHELRHFMQYHMMASCSNASSEYIDKNIRMGNISNQLKSLYETFPETKEIADKIPFESVDYAQNYSPKFLLPQSLPIKTSWLNSDSRYMQLGDLFGSWQKLKGSYIPENDDFDLNEYLASISDITPESYNQNNYYPDLAEIDAYNNQLEFIYANERKYSVGARKFVIDMMIKNLSDIFYNGYFSAIDNKNLPETLLFST